LRFPQRWHAIILLAASAIPGATLAQEAANLQLRPCRPAGFPEEVRCGTYEVPEHRDRPGGRRIALRIVVLPARGTPAPDPVFDLEGGPGASAVAAARGFLQSPLRRQRDLIFVDARGTGGAGRLECAFRETTGDTPAYLAEFLPLEGVRACRAELERRADLTRYTALDVVDDLEDVRRALGVRQVTLYGTSGGTRVALIYLLRYPSSVRAALLHGPVPLDARIPLSFAADAQAALDGVLGACEGEPACRRAFPDARARLATLLDNVERRPARVTLTDSATGELRTLVITRPAAAQIIRYMLYTPANARDLPRAIHLGAGGEFEPLARMGLVFAGIPSGVATGFYLSNTCSEDLPWITDAEAMAAAAGTFLGDYRYRQQQSACAEWPRRELPPGHRETVQSTVPTLILVGEHDPVTPPRWGRELAAQLTRAKLVVVPGGGHSFRGLAGAGCVLELITAFIESAAPERLETGCLTGVRRPPFTTG